jgi:hypothetical protein
MWHGQRRLKVALLSRSVDSQFVMIRSPSGHSVAHVSSSHKLLADTVINTPPGGYRCLFDRRDTIAPFKFF